MIAPPGRLQWQPLVFNESARNRYHQGVGVSSDFDFQISKTRTNLGVFFYIIFSIDYVRIERIGSFLFSQEIDASLKYPMVVI